MWVWLNNYTVPTESSAGRPPRRKKVVAGVDRRRTHALSASQQEKSHKDIACCWCWVSHQQAPHTSVDCSVFEFESSRSPLRAHHHHQSTPAWLTRRTSANKYSAPSAMQICQQSGDSSTKVCGILMILHARDAHNRLIILCSFCILHRECLLFSDTHLSWCIERPLLIKHIFCNYANGERFYN